MLLEESQANPLSFSGSQETKNPPLFTPSEKSALFGQALCRDSALRFYRFRCSLDGVDFRYGLLVQKMPRLRLRSHDLIPGISFGREPSNSTDGTFTRVASGFPGARHVEPGLILDGSGLAWAILAMALVIGWFIPRVFCRYVCPYRILPGILATVGFWRREIDKEACLHCNRCLKQCPVQAIKPSSDGKILKLSSYQCVQCGQCSGACRRRAV